jgi:hypothetical protein
MGRLIGQPLFDQPTTNTTTNHLNLVRGEPEKPRSGEQLGSYG